MLTKERGRHAPKTWRPLEAPSFADAGLQGLTANGLDDATLRAAAQWGESLVRSMQQWQHVQTRRGSQSYRRPAPEPVPTSVPPILRTHFFRDGEAG